MTGPGRLTSAQRMWVQRYCKPRRCQHSRQLTWACIEAFLASKPGSSGLEDVRAKDPGPLFAMFLEATGLGEDAEPTDALPLLDTMYRKYIQFAAPRLLKASAGGA